MNDAMNENDNDAIEKLTWEIKDAYCPDPEFCRFNCLTHVHHHLNSNLIQCLAYNIIRNKYNIITWKINGHGNIIETRFREFGPYLSRIIQRL